MYWRWLDTDQGKGEIKNIVALEALLGKNALSMLVQSYGLRKRFKTMKRILGFFLCSWLAATLCYSADIPQTWIDEFRSFSAQLAWPVMAPAEESCAWEIELEATINFDEGNEAKVQELKAPILENWSWLQRKRAHGLCCRNTKKPLKTSSH